MEGDAMAGMPAEPAGQRLPQMDPDERRAALEELRAMIDEEFFKLAQEGTREDLRCPHCGCPRFVKRGLDAAGGQRHLCRGCGRTFLAEAWQTSCSENGIAGCSCVSSVWLVDRS